MSGVDLDGSVGGLYEPTEPRARSYGQDALMQVDEGLCESQGRGVRDGTGPEQVRWDLFYGTQTPGRLIREPALHRLCGQSPREVYSLGETLLQVRSFGSAPSSNLKSK